jgi:DNA primase
VIPQGFIQDLLARVDIVDVIGRYVALKKAGQNYVGLCPFHGEKTPSFTVSPSKQFFHCFGCGAHGSAIGFLMDHRGLGYTEAIRELAQQVGMQVPDGGARDRAGAARVRGLTDALEQASDYYRRKLKETPAAIEYLKHRGVTGQTAARFALGYSPDAWQALRDVFPTYEDPRLVEAGLVIVGDEGRRYDRFRGRVMFPIRNRRGAVIGFGARVLEGGEPKYLNSPETPVFRKGQELYGLFEAQAAIRRRQRVIVCEGYLDVIQLAQAGFDESVAALGTAITAQHVAQLLRAADHVIFAFDGDAAGRKAARRALEATLPVIADTKRASFALLPEGEDPDSLIRSRGAEGFEQQLARALPLSRWFVASLADGKDLERAEDRAALVAQARPLLESMPPAALRMQLVRELAESARTPAADLESLFGLKPWRRLAAAHRPANRPRGGTEVEGLKARIVQHLLAFPELAREFNAQIAAEFAGAEQPVDRQIAEIWRTATLAGSTSQGALLEALADSEFAEAYRAIARRDLLLEGDASAAREDLREGFAKLELQRVEEELAALVREPLTPESKERIRELSERRVRLKEAPRRAGAN